MYVPIILRYRKVVPILFIVLSLFFIGKILFDENLELKIKVSAAKNSKLAEQPVAIYGVNTVFADGILVIEKPSLAQKLFYPAITDFDILGNLVILVVAFSLLFISKKINVSDPFRTNIEKYLAIIGAAFVIYYILDRLRLYIIKDTILSITNNEFTINKHPVTGTFSLWIGILILWIRLILKKGKLLQQEQDLTV